MLGVLRYSEIQLITYFQGAHGSVFVVGLLILPTMCHWQFCGACPWMCNIVNASLYAFSSRFVTIFCSLVLNNLAIFRLTSLALWIHLKMLGPFCLLLRVSPDYAHPITGQVTEVTCLWLTEHSLTLLGARDRKRNLVKRYHRRLCPSQWI